MPVLDKEVKMDTLDSSIIEEEKTQKKLYCVKIGSAYYASPFTAYVAAENPHEAETLFRTLLKDRKKSIWEFTSELSIHLVAIEGGDNKSKSDIPYLIL
jgi:hypothetical protein